jgi:hypothetical protein
MTTAVDGKIMTMIENASSLTELAREIREACQAARRSGLTALDHIFRAGEALSKAQEQVTGNWKRWLRENCFLGVSTALLYQRIAHHRGEIETKAKEDPSFSLRAARRLITEKPKGGAKASKATKATEVIQETESAETELKTPPSRGRDAGNVPHVVTRIDSKGRRQLATGVRKSATKVEASPSPSVLTAPPGSRAVFPPPLVVAGNSLDPEASAAARKAFYAATELPPADMTTNYAANRRSGERHPALTRALRTAVLAAESGDPAAEIVRAFKEFVILAAALNVPVDRIDVCARRALQ